jgi:hypothetical protein
LSTLIVCSRFVVNENTGEITTSKDADKDKKILDRETIDTYYITYEAMDGGNSKATTMLEISLTDQNDNPPIFVRSSYEGHIREGDTKLEREVKVEVNLLVSGIFRSVLKNAATILIACLIRS